ncbi:glycosyltransferase [Paenibacillus sp. y28]|uniref:glycosyltransferase n=1 Tax=Paenibacillus sp. y28 TaxID=3129110 RepID=UPI0030176DF8
MKVSSPALDQIWIVAPSTILAGETGFDRFRYLAEKLTERGHRVRLLTSSFSHTERRFRDKETVERQSRRSGYSIDLLRENGFWTDSLWERLRSSMQFNAHLQALLDECKQPPKLIYSACPQIGAARIAARFAKRWNIPFAVDIVKTSFAWDASSVLPVMLPSGLRKALGLPFRLQAERIYGMADYVVGVSDSAVEHGRHVNSHAKAYCPVYIGADVARYNEVNDSFYKPQSQFWFTSWQELHSGCDTGTAIRAIARVKQQGYPHVMLFVLGSGPYEDKLKRLAADLKAPVRFMGRCSEEEAAACLKWSDAALGLARDGDADTLAARLGDYLSAGLPVLHSSPELQKLLAPYGLGEVYSPGNDKQLAELMLQWLQQKERLEMLRISARRLAAAKFDRSVSYEGIFKFIEGEIACS